MIRRLAAFTVATLLASAPLADTYQGLTIGQPAPALGTQLTETLWGERAGGASLSPPLSTLCARVYLTIGHGGVYADSADGCDGPVLRIRATEPVRIFTDPVGGRGFKMQTGLDGLYFDTTTLADMRALFGSEGLSGGRFGLTTPDFIDSYWLAYGISGTDTLAVFAFQNPIELRPLGSTEPPPPTFRDSAQLISIELISPRFFDIIGDEIPTRPSQNYAPIPNIFAE